MTAHVQEVTRVPHEAGLLCQKFLPAKPPTGSYTCADPLLPVMTTGCVALLRLQAGTGILEDCRLGCDTRTAPASHLLEGGRGILKGAEANARTRAAISASCSLSRSCSCCCHVLPAQLSVPSSAYASAASLAPTCGHTAMSLARSGGQVWKYFLPITVMPVFSGQPEGILACGCSGCPAAM